MESFEAKVNSVLNKARDDAGERHRYEDKCKQSALMAAKCSVLLWACGDWTGGLLSPYLVHMWSFAADKSATCSVCAVLLFVYR